MIRLFIALKIPDEIKNHISTLRKSIYPSAAGLRWEPEEKLHLTLKFIGEVPGESLDKIISSLDFINNYKKFNCSFTGFGFFFNRKQPKILWAGFRADKSLLDLADRLNKHFISFSIPAEERKFNAHLTLLRIRDYPGKDFIEAFENYRAEETPFIADEVALIKSELFPSGSKYIELQKFYLN